MWLYLITPCANWNSNNRHTKLTIYEPQNIYFILIINRFHSIDFPRIFFAIALIMCLKFSLALLHLFLFLVTIVSFNGLTPPSKSNDPTVQLYIRGLATRWYWVRSKHLNQRNQYATVQLLFDRRFRVDSISSTSLGWFCVDRFRRTEEMRHTTRQTKPFLDWAYVI